MGKSRIACLLLSLTMLMACVLGASAAAVPAAQKAAGYIPTQPWRDQPNGIEQILERDGYLEGIWFPWFRHTWLGHCLTGNDLYAEKTGSDSWMTVGLDQYGETNIYREIYNLKALGFNIMGYEGSPLSEGVVYDAYGNVLGVKQDYLQNIRRLLNICRQVGMPVLWTLTMHSTVSSEYWENGKLAWDITAQAYSNPKVADQYAEKFIKPVCQVLAEYPDVVMMVSVGVELENEINDSDIGNYFDHRFMYGVEQEPMLYFINAVTKMAKKTLPDVSRVVASTSSDFTIYEDIDLDFIGKNHYTMAADAPGIEKHRSTAPMIVTEFGFGDGVQIADELWTVKQIQFRENFIKDGCSGWMMWCWSNDGYGTAYDLLDANGTSTTDFRVGAYTIKYFADTYRAAYRGEEIVLDTPVLFCNRGSGLVEWISSRQATQLTLERSTDGGKTWKTLLKKVDPSQYEKDFKGSYTDAEIANKKADGTKTMYRITVWDDEGNKRVSTPSNEATVLGPSVNILKEQNLNYSFENGLSGWTEFGQNGTYAEGANYSAKVITAAAQDGKKVLDFKLNHSKDGGELVLGQQWFGIHMDDVTVKPNTQYEIKVTYKIAPDALFAYDESDNTHKMSGYLIVRGENFNGDELTQLYMLAGSKNEWRQDKTVFKTDASGKICLDLRAVHFNNIPIHYYIDCIEIYEVK